MANDYTTIFPVATVAPQLAGKPVCYPTSLSGGATLDIRPVTGCQGCTKAQTANHTTFHQWRILDGSSDPYEGASPWADAMNFDMRWLWYSRAILYWMEKWTEGMWSVVFGGNFGATLFNGYDINGEFVANFVNGVSYTVISASGDNVIIDTDSPASDPRQAISGLYPLQAGDFVAFTGNNCAANRLYAYIKSLTPTNVGGSQPTSVTLTLDRDVTPALTTASDTGSGHSAGVWIGREDSAQQDWQLPWLDPDTELLKAPTTRVEAPDFFFGVQKQVEYSSGSFGDGSFVLKNASGGNVAVAYPAGIYSGFNRLLIVETSADGVTYETDITETVTGGGMQGSGRLFVTHANDGYAAGDATSTLYLGATVNGVGGHANLLSGAMAVRITYWWETTPTDYANEREIVCARRCKHCRPDYGGIWGDSSSANPQIGVKMYCAKRATASGLANFSPRCYLVNNCNEFEPLEKLDFVHPAQVRQIVESLWVGIPGALAQDDAGDTHLDNWKWWRVNHPSIFGFMTPKNFMAYPNNYTPHFHPFGCGNFGRINGSDQFVGGAAHALSSWGTDSDVTDIDTFPEEGALPVAVSGWTTKHNQTDNAVLDASSDPFKDFRRHFGASMFGMSRQTAQSLGEGLALYQRLANGYSGAAETVLLSNLQNNTNWQAVRDGAVKFGAWSAALDELADGDPAAVYTMLVRLYRMPYAARQGQLWFNEVGYLAATVHTITDNGGGEFEIEFYPDYERAVYTYVIPEEGPQRVTVTFLAGGNVGGMPEYWRINNDLTSFFRNYIGPAQATREGHVVTFWVNDSTPASLGPDGNPHPYQIIEVAPFAGNNFTWNEGLFSPYDQTTEDGIYDAGIGRCLTMPPDFKNRGNKADVIRVQDPSGNLAAALAATDIGEGTTVVFSDGAVLPWSSAIPAFFQDDREEAGPTTNWTSISSGDVAEVNRVSGFFAVKKAAADPIRSGITIGACLRLDCPDGRYSNAAYISADAVNLTRKALQALDTVRIAFLGKASDVALTGGRYRFQGFLSSEFLTGGGSGASLPENVTLSGSIAPVIWASETQPTTYEDWFVRSETGFPLGVATDATTADPTPPTAWNANNATNRNAGAATYSAGNAFRSSIQLGAYDPFSFGGIGFWTFDQNGVAFEADVIRMLPDGLTITKAVAVVTLSCAGLTLDTYRNVIVETAFANPFTGSPTYATVVTGATDAFSALGAGFTAVYGAIGHVSTDSGIAGRVRLALVGLKPGGEWDILRTIADSGLGSSGAFLADGLPHEVDVTSMMQAYYDNRAAAYTGFYVIAQGPTGTGFPSVTTIATISHAWLEAGLGIGATTPATGYVIEHVDTSMGDVILQFTDGAIQFEFDDAIENVLPTMAPPENIPAMT